MGKVLLFDFTIIDKLNPENPQMRTRVSGF